MYNWIYSNKKRCVPDNHSSVCAFTVVTDNLTLRMFNNNEEIATNETNYCIENKQ
jgi:hypothetical protein